MNIRSDELSGLLKQIDQCIQLLNQVDVEYSLDSIQKVKEKVEWSFRRLQESEWCLLREVVYFLELACFHLLIQEGEFFPIYLTEINQRYRQLLNRLQKMSRRESYLTMV